MSTKHSGPVTTFRETKSSKQGIEQYLVGVTNKDGVELYDSISLSPKTLKFAPNITRNGVACFESCKGRTYKRWGVMRVAKALEAKLGEPVALKEVGSHIEDIPNLKLQGTIVVRPAKDEDEYDDHKFLFEGEELVARNVLSDDESKALYEDDDLDD